MQIGSLVECYKENTVKRTPAEKKEAQANLKKAGYVWPQLKELYVVRGFVETQDGKVGIYLEEIVNPKVLTPSGWKEVGWHIEMFREVQPPVNVFDLLEQKTLANFANSLAAPKPSTIKMNEYYRIEQQYFNGIA